MGTRLSLAKRLEACVSHDPNFICTENTCCSIREWCTTPSRFIFIFKFPQTRRAKRVWVSLYGKGKQLDYYMHAALVELHQICHFIIPNFNLRDSLQILQLSLDGTSNQSKSWNCYKSADTSTPSHAFCHLLNLRTLLSHGPHGNLPAVLGRPKLASCWNIYIYMPDQLTTNKTYTFAPWAHTYAWPPLACNPNDHISSFFNSSYFDIKV